MPHIIDGSNSVRSQIQGLEFDLVTQILYNRDTILRDVQLFQIYQFVQILDFCDTITL